MSNIRERSKKIVSLEPFKEVCQPEYAGAVSMECPLNRQYILRMLIRRGTGEYKVPQYCDWIYPMLHKAMRQQRSYGINHPYCYLTIRHGLVESVTDDVWHVDGFSTRITHLPEQNYIWSDFRPTQFLNKAFPMPSDFDPQRHNVHQYIQDNFDEERDADDVYQVRRNEIYCLDPYVIHRRPASSNGVRRTFVRISFTPIEIDDIHNTYNPLLPTAYTLDNVRDFRDRLERYVPPKPEPEQEERENPYSRYVFTLPLNNSDWLNAADAWARFSNNIQTVRGGSNVVNYVFQNEPVESIDETDSDYVAF